MSKSKSSYFIIGMILLSLALGIFNSYFFVFVNALFISEIGTSKLPMAYLLSGFGGLLITWLFNSAEKRWGFAKASTGFGLFFALVMLAIWVAYVEGLYLYFLIFFAYAWLWVSSNFTSLVFWKLPSNIFNLEETKKYNGIISSGEGISSIISYLSVPALLTLEFFTRDKFLMISFFGMLSFTVLTFILSRGIKARPVVKPLEENSATNAENQKKVSKEPYFRYIFFAVMLAVVIQFLVDFSLMEVSASQMSDPLVLASYFSLLFGGMRILELILKSFFSKFLVKQYGVFISLSTMIFALGFITIIGISSFFIGYLSILLIVSSLSKVFERSLYRSVYAPTINLLYQAYPIEKRGLTQNYADGFGKTIGQLIAAVLIFIVSTIQSFEYKVLALLILVFAILIIWLLVSRKLIYFYRIELSNILSSLTGPIARESEVKEVVQKEVVLQVNKPQHLGPVEQVMQTINKFLSIETIDVAGRANDSNSDFIKKNSENEESIFVSETENLIEIVKSCSAPQLEKILDQLVPLKLSHQRFGRLLQLIELFLQTSLIQKNTSFNFHNSQKNLKVTDFLYTSVIQNLVNKQVQNLENQEYYQLLEDRIQKYTYLLICHKDLGKSYPELDKLILLEINATKNDILFCLSFKHDPLTVNQIVTMINQGDKSQELISLELLELILQEQEKKWVLPIFKENTPDKILVKLENDFAQVLLGNEKRLLSILGAFKLDIPNLIKAKALEALLLHFPNSLNQELAKTIKKNNLNLNSLAIDLGFEERKVDQGGSLGNLTSLTPKPKIDQNSQLEDEISLHYSYWMDANETEQVKNLIYHKMKPIFRTLFPVVFPLEKVT